MAVKSYARISRVHGSWRVRVPGHAPKFFADSEYGDGSSPTYARAAALAAARKWRDRHWNGKDRREKLTPTQRNAIRRSKEHYLIVAEKYNITPAYVYQLRREEDE